MRRGGLPRPLLYFFHRTVEWHVANGRMSPVFFSVCVVTVMLNVNVAMLMAIASNTLHLDSLVALDQLARTAQRRLHYAAFFVSLAALYWYLTASPQQRHILEVYQHESDASRRRGTALCIAYWVVSALLLIGAMLSR